MTNEKGEFSFPISSFEYYTLVSGKEGFLKGSTVFNTDNKTTEYNDNVTLKVEPAPRVGTEEKTFIQIDNILCEIHTNFTYGRKKKGHNAEEGRPS